MARIAKLEGLGEKAVAYRLRKAGVQSRQTMQANIGTEEQLKRLYETEGLTLHQIAKQLGIGSATVRRRLKKAGVQLRHRGYSSRVKHEANRILSRVVTRGYIKVLQKGHPRATGKGYVLEHILVWEEAHGRSLPKGWVIHHLNGIKSDNRPENLRALATTRHNTLIPTLKQRIRELEIETRQLKRALEDGQMLFYIGEN